MFIKDRKKGERVAIWAPNIYQWILAAIGAQSIGGVVVPLNTRYKGVEAAYVLNASGAKMLFTVGEFLGTRYPEMLVDQSLPDLEQTVTLTGDAKGCSSWDKFLAAGESVPVEEVTRRVGEASPHDTRDILFTAGTSGNPKGVGTCHGANIRRLEK